MQIDHLKHLIQEIKRQKTERQNIELKAANKGCPTKLHDTLSSFSNQNDGGIIIFGIDENKNYEIVGVYDAQDLQKRVSEQCNQMEPKVIALFTVCEIDSKLVVAAEIPSVEVDQRPVFYKGAGRIRGSYIRVGDRDEIMNEREVYAYDAFRKRKRDDARLVDGANMKLFNKELLAKYLEALKKDKKNLSEYLSDDEILSLMGIASDNTPTLAGLLTFSIYPQAYFPQLCITAIAVPGTQIGELGNDFERFIDNKRITGSILEMVDTAVEFVMKNSRIKTIIDELGKRRDKPEYPTRAIREAILNSILHRDYSIHTENIPIRLIMYRDRLELINPGGLYGKTSISELSKVEPDTRNVVLANMLEVLNIVENRYSGIPTIIAETKNARMPNPIFSSYKGEFSVTFKNNIYQDSSEQLTSSISDSILQYCEIPRTRAELIKFTNMSRYYTMSAIVKPLIEEGKLKLTIPQKPKSSMQKYVRA